MTIAPANIFEWPQGAEGRRLRGAAQPLTGQLRAGTFTDWDTTPRDDLRAAIQLWFDTLLKGIEKLDGRTHQTLIESLDDDAELLLFVGPSDQTTDEAGKTVPTNLQDLVGAMRSLELQIKVIRDRVAALERRREQVEEHRQAALRLPRVSGDKGVLAGMKLRQRDLLSAPVSDTADDEALDAIEAAIAELRRRQQGMPTARSVQAAFAPPGASNVSGDRRAPGTRRPKRAKAVRHGRNGVTLGSDGTVVVTAQVGDPEASEAALAAKRYPSGRPASPTPAQTDGGKGSKKKPNRTGSTN